MIVVVKCDRENTVRTSRVSRWLEKRDIEHRIAASPFDIAHESVIFVDDLDLPSKEDGYEEFVRRVRRLRDVRKVLK